MQVPVYNRNKLTLCDGGGGGLNKLQELGHKNTRNVQMFIPISVFRTRIWIDPDSESGSRIQAGKNCPKKEKRKMSRLKSFTVCRAGGFSWSLNAFVEVRKTLITNFEKKLK